MSEWIESELAKHEKVKSDLRAIDLGADRLFGELWDEVVLLSEFAASKRTGTFTNGTPSERIVAMSVNPSPGQGGILPRKMVIKLVRDKRMVKASSDAGSVEFAMEIYADGVLLLTQDGRPVSPKEAAQLIMKPFLFEGKSPFITSI